MKSKLKLGKLEKIRNTKRSLSFIKRLIVQMNHLSIPATGTTITLQLVILCMNNTSKISSDTAYETSIISYLVY